MKRTARTAFVVFVFVALVGLSFLGGIVAAARYPNAAQPVAQRAYGVVSSAWAAVTGLIRGNSVAGLPSVEAMNVNTFRTTRLGDLPGTVIFGIRGQLPGFQDRLVEVDRDGNVLWEYRAPAGMHIFGEVRTLSNNNVLFIETSGALPAISPDVPKWVVEVDRTNRVIRRDLLPVTHHAELLPSGNLLLVDSGRNRVSEVDAQGTVVWSWDAQEQLRSYGPSNFVGMSDADQGSRVIQNAYADFREGGLLNTGWTHMNSAQRLPNGNTVISIRNFDLVVEVDPGGRVIWSFGPLVIKHQHCAWILENGNLLVTDNGNARVLEVNRRHEVIWEYSTGLQFATQACAYRLPSGNTLITDAYNRRIIEVTQARSVVWELKMETPGAIPFYRAWWVPPR